MSVSVNLVLTDAGRTYVAGGVVRTREVEVRVFAPDKPGDYPVVFWGHGFAASPAGSASNLPRLWADQGFIVVVPTHLDSTDTLIRPTVGPPNQMTLHRVADMRFLLSSFESLSQALNAAHPGYSGDMSHPIAAGHSHGAFVASLLTGVVSARPELAGTTDARFTAAVLVSPQGATGPSTSFGLYYNSPTDHSWTRVHVPTLVLTGTDDTGTDNQTFEDRLDGFEYAPAGAKHAMVIRGANHIEMFSGADQAVLQEVVSGAATFSRAYARQDAIALNTLMDTAGYSAAHPLMSAVYARAGGAETGALQGTSAADKLGGLQTADRIEGLGGADQLSGEAGNDLLLGGAGDDDLRGGAGRDVLEGGDGNDLLSGDAGDDTLDGGAGYDTASYAGAPGGVVVSLGAATQDTGGAGVDTLIGIEGLIGSSHADQLHGDDGANTIVGRSGLDHFYGHGGNDQLLGADLRDVMYGGAGDDLLEGGDGDDRLEGGGGNDALLAGAGADALLGLEGDDYLNGGAGLNYLDGGAGADILIGGQDRETLNGGDGADRLTGGGGSDDLVGGAGADIFLWLALSDSAAGAFDRIYDFDAAEDRLDVSAIDANPFLAGDQAFALTAGFTGRAGEAVLLRYQDSNSSALLLDADGDGVADFVLAFSGTSPAGDWLVL